MGVGEATQNAKLMDGAVNELTQIAGQRPVITKARKSMSHGTGHWYRPQVTTVMADGLILVRIIKEDISPKHRWRLVPSESLRMGTIRHTIVTPSQLPYLSTVHQRPMHTSTLTS